MRRAKYLSNRPQTQEAIRQREQMIIEHASLVKIAAMRLASRLPSCIDVDDLFSAGVIGLMDAIEKFDPGRGVPFEVYARLRIHGAIVDQIREMDWVPRLLRKKSRTIEKCCAEIDRRTGQIPDDEAIAAEMGVSLAEYYRQLDEVKGISLMPENIDDFVHDDSGSLVAPESDEPFRKVYGFEMKERLTDAIEKLPEKERIVLSLYYDDELTLDEIGAVLGCTGSRVSQIRTKAILGLRGKLSRALKRDDLPDHSDPDTVVSRKTVARGKNGRPGAAKTLLAN